MIHKTRERVKHRGEVFTPKSLIEVMLDKLPPETWTDSSKTFLDSSAGNGNFLVAVKRRLLKYDRSLEVHVLEHQLFAIELNIDSVMELQHRLGYLVSGEPNPLLDRKHFVIADELHEECRRFCPTHLEPTYTHHRNIVCADALTYDYGFGRDAKALLLGW
jgi:hypothetical protein